MTDLYNSQEIEATIAQIGPQGPKGDGATIAIGTVTTGAAGSDASVINSGTATNAVLDFVIPKGDTGAQGIQGPQGIQGLTGLTGNGIASVSKVSTSGLVDTYRIEFTDNTHYDFTVTNGNGISSIEKTSTSGLVDTYTITYTDTTTHTFTVTNGAKGEQGEKGDTGATGNGVSGTSLISTVGLVKTYRMSYTNGSHFDYEVKDGAAGATEWGGISGVLSNQTDLEQALHALKGYKETGNVLTDSVGYADVYNYAHSTFDDTKFTGVGSPSITNDGILYDTSNSKYVSIPIATVSDMANGGSWRIDFGGKMPASASSTFRNVQCNTNGINIGNINGNGNYFLQVYDTNGTSHAVYLGNYVGNNLNKDYIGYASFDGVSTYTIACSVDNGATWTSNTMTASELVYFSTSTLRFGSGESTLSTATYDLKKYAIHINGIPVFSGTKTGIDTIKPVDFTSVANGASTVNPTLPLQGYFLNITADGIASGFSDNDYIYSTTTISTSSNIIFKGKGIVTGSGIQRIFDTNATRTSSNTTFQTLVFDLDNSKVYFDCYKNNTFTRVLNQNITINSGEVVEFDINIGLSSQSYDIKINSREYHFTTNTALSTQEISNIYAAGTPSNYYWQGSIDLNSFKVYVNGNLVYQPCLLIPYSKSKTGSKVVDVAYRHRVQDMYEQFGCAPYYTIDEVNQNFTLPMGEVYGMINEKADVDLSNMNPTQTVKDTIIGWGMPDSSNRVQVVFQSGSYTPTKDGYINVAYILMGSTAEITLTLGTSNIVGYCKNESADNIYYSPTGFIPIAKNQKFSISPSAAASNATIYFYPMKGE